MEKDCFFEDDTDWFRYRAVAIVIEENHVLFVGNSRDDYLYTLGGAVKLGEKSEDAVKREVLEETGINYEIDRFLGVYENFFHGNNGKSCHEIALCYLMKPKGKILDTKIKSVTMDGITEKLHWIALDKMKECRVFPEKIKDIIDNRTKEFIKS